MKMVNKYSKVVVLFTSLSVLSVLLSWAGVPAKEKLTARRTTPADCIRAENGVFNIQGTVLLSPEDGFVYVQSNNSFLKIQRDLIKGADDATLDHPGSRVALQTPQSAIRYAWSAELNEADEESTRSIAQYSPRGGNCD